MMPVPFAIKQSPVSDGTKTDEHVMPKVRQYSTFSSNEAEGLYNLALD